MKFPNFYFKRRKRPSYLRLKLSGDNDTNTKIIEGFTTQNGVPTIYAPFPLISKNSHNIELNGVGDYKDILMIDGETNVKRLTRKTGKVVYDGTELWDLLEFEENELIYCVIEDGLNIGNRDSHFICSHAPVSTYGSGNIAGQGTVVDASNNSLQPTFLFENNKFGTVKAWKEFLKEQYDKGTPITLVYALAEPITTKF